MGCLVEKKFGKNGVNASGQIFDINHWKPECRYINKIRGLFLSLWMLEQVVNVVTTVLIEEYAVRRKICILTHKICMSWKVTEILDRISR